MGPGQGTTQTNAALGEDAGVSNVRKTVKEKVEKRGDGVNVVAAVNAVVTGNVAEEGKTSTSATSHQRVVQRSGRTVVFSEQHTETRAEAPADEPLDVEELHGEEAKELPHREGTLDRLQEAAEVELAREEGEAPEQDSETAREQGKRPER